MLASTARVWDPTVQTSLADGSIRAGSESLEGSVGKVPQVLPFQRFSVATPLVSEIPHATVGDTAATVCETGPGTCVKELPFQCHGVAPMNHTSLPEVPPATIMAGSGAAI